MDWVKITDFLNELSEKKTLTDKNQSTYTCSYKRRRYFIGIMTHLKDVGLIEIRQNNGTYFFKLTLAGDLFRILMNNALKR